MSKVIMIGCDLHDQSILLRYAVGTEQPQQLTYPNDVAGRRRMIARLKRSGLIKPVRKGGRKYAVNLANSHGTPRVGLCGRGLPEGW